MRFHAFGDMIATLPYINDIKNVIPNAEIHLLTAERVALIPRSIEAIDKVIGIRGGMNAKLLFFNTVLQIPKLLIESYDLILDLQNDKKSNLVKTVLFSKSKSSFEKYTPKFTGERYREYISKNLGECSAEFKCSIRAADLDISPLENSPNYIKKAFFIVLNPAGYYKTRNWPIQNYLNLCEKLVLEYGAQVRFLLLGDSRMEEKAELIESANSEYCINLVNKTSQIQALSILSKVDLVLSEDSGLGHMSWIQGVKTVFLFGSTRADWTAPPYDHVRNFTSTDMECGDCMKSECKWGDVRCLTRYDVDQIFKSIVSLIK